MSICRKGAADAQLIGAGLFLPDPPLGPAIPLRVGQVAEQLRPADAGLDLDEATRAVETEHAAHASHVEEQGAGAELLAAHGVPATGDADRTPLGAGVSKTFTQRPQRIRIGDAVHARFVQTGVMVVDLGPLGRCLRGSGRNA